MENLSGFISNLAVSLPVFLIAIIAHEYAHARVALICGDSTAKDYGRLTFHPWPHIDIIGTIIFPLIGAAAGGLMFGWAKPVPVDSRHFKNYRKGIFWVSFAGPLANIFISIFSAFMLAAIYLYLPDSFILKPFFVLMLKQSVYINILLAVFNLVPIPPLDGSKMVASFMDYNMMVKYQELSRYSFIFFLVLIFTNVWSYVLSPFFTLGSYMIGIFYQMLA